MAFSRCNSSTPVPPLGTSFNTISCFSDQMAYPPNAPWHSRWIHQRGRSSLRSPSSTIQPGWTVSPVPGPSIVTMDNDPNWEDAPTTNPITNLTTIDRHLLLTHGQNPIRAIILMSNWLKYLADLLTLLILIRLPDLILIQEELKPTSLTLSVALSLTSSIISCFNAGYISTLIQRNLTRTLQKSTSQWPTLLE